MLLSMSTFSSKATKPPPIIPQSLIKFPTLLFLYFISCAFIFIPLANAVEPFSVNLCDLCQSKSDCGSDSVCHEGLCEPVMDYQFCSRREECQPCEIDSQCRFHRCIDSVCLRPDHNAEFCFSVDDSNGISVRSYLETQSKDEKSETVALNHSGLQEQEEYEKKGKKNIEGIGRWNGWGGPKNEMDEEINESEREGEEDRKGRGKNRWAKRRQSHDKEGRDEEKIAEKKKRRKWRRKTKKHDAYSNDDDNYSDHKRRKRRKWRNKRKWKGKQKGGCNNKRYRRRKWRKKKGLNGRKQGQKRVWSKPKPKKIWKYGGSNGKNRIGNARANTSTKSPMPSIVPRGFPTTTGDPPSITVNTIPALPNSGPDGKEKKGQEMKSSKQGGKCQRCRKLSDNGFDKTPCDSGMRCMQGICRTGRRQRCGIKSACVACVTDEECRSGKCMQGRCAFKDGKKKVSDCNLQADCAACVTHTQCKSGTCNWKVCVPYGGMWEDCQHI